MDSVVIFIVVILFAAWITYYILKHLKNNTSLIFFKLSNYIYIFKLNRKRYIEAELNLIEKFLESIEIYKSNYFTNSLKIKLLEEYEGLYNKFQYGKFRYITNKDVDKFKNIYKDLDILVKKWNESYVENELIKTTKAYEEGHIVYVNPQAWYVGGSGIMAIDTIISDMETALNIK